MRANAAAIGPGFGSILNRVVAGWRSTRVRLGVTHLALAIRVREAILANQAALRARHAATIDVGFIAVLNGIGTAWCVTGAVSVADLTLAIERDCALEPFTARRTAPTTVDVGFAGVERLILTGGGDTNQCRAGFLDAIVVCLASISIHTPQAGSDRHARPTAIFARFLPVSNAVGASGNLALPVLARPALAIRRGRAGKPVSAGFAASATVLVGFGAVNDLIGAACCGADACDAVVGCA